MQLMVRPKGFVEGNILSQVPKVIRLPKDMTELRLELEPNKKGYRMHVICRFFSSAAESAAGLRQGQRIHVTGDFDVEQTRTGSDVYGNVVILSTRYELVEPSD